MGAYDDTYPHPLAAFASPADGELETPSEPTAQAQDLPASFPRLPGGIRLLLYTPEQAAVLLAIRPSWLRRAAADGSIACTYLGKHLRFSDADLHAILADGASGPRPAFDHPATP